MKSKTGLPRPLHGDVLRPAETLVKALIASLRPSPQEVRRFRGMAPGGFRHGCFRLKTGHVI